MSFMINGQAWKPKTTVEHADLIIDKINNLLVQENVTDDDGRIVQLNKSYANALYLLALGDGNRLADNDMELSRAINSFNIELADERQVENLMPIAAVTRNPGSYSTLLLSITASPDGECVVPAGTRAPYENVFFVVQEDVTIPANNTITVNTICDTIGNISVLEGEVTAFETFVANCAAVYNYQASIPGKNIETTNEIRERIMKGYTIPYTLDGVRYALEELTGISHARVYFNYRNNENITLPGDIVVKPRTAYIVVNGHSPDIAKVYGRYMIAETQNVGDTVGSYTTVNVKFTAGDEEIIITDGTFFNFDGYTFKCSGETTVAAQSTADVVFTATTVGKVKIPSDRINDGKMFVPEFTGANVTNDASIEGVDRTGFEQNYVTASGQVITIKYDIVSQTTLFVRIYLNVGSENGVEITKLLKRDLLASSVNWLIGQTITSIVTDAPFVNCTYTSVAYTQISLNGFSYLNSVDVAANSIPRITDDTIEVVLLT